MHPPFHLTGDPSGDFYALAYVDGTYSSPSGSTREEGFLVMYFSPSPDFTHLSFRTCTRAGRMLSYSRGNDRLNTLEFALITASYEYDVPSHAWQLFPVDLANDYWKVNDAHAIAYAAMRKQLCSVLYFVRMRAWSKKTVPSLFTPIATEVANPMDPTPENEEIFRSAFEGNDEVDE
jgi:hypothetical protein